MDGKSNPTPFLKVPLYGETVEDAIRDLLDVDVSVDEDCLHLGWVYLKIWNFFEFPKKVLVNNFILQENNCNRNLSIFEFKIVHSLEKLIYNDK